MNLFFKYKTTSLVISFWKLKIICVYLFVLLFLAFMSHFEPIVQDNAALHVEIAQKKAYEKVINNNYQKISNKRNKKNVANEKNMNLGICG